MEKDVLVARVRVGRRPDGFNYMNITPKAGESQLTDSSHERPLTCKGPTLNTIVCQKDLLSRNVGYINVTHY